MVYVLEWVDEKRGEAIFLGTYTSQILALKEISDMWKRLNFVPNYIRYIEGENYLEIDYGSHYLFYRVTEIKLD